MAARFNMINEICPPLMSWSIKVMICRMWYRPDSTRDPSIKALELIVVDEQVTSIQNTPANRLYVY